MIIPPFVEPEAVIMTDDFASYRGLGKEFAAHGVVRHGREEYALGFVHVNTAENFFSLLKRGITGVYHHVSKQHLERYIKEFDFRYNARYMSDAERMMCAIEE